MYLRNLDKSRLFTIAKVKTYVVAYRFAVVTLPHNLTTMLGFGFLVATLIFQATPSLAVLSALAYTFRRCFLFRNPHALRDVMSFSKFGDFSLFLYSATSIISKFQHQKPEPSRSCATVNRTTFFDFQRTESRLVFPEYLSHRVRFFDSVNIIHPLHIFVK